MTAEEAVAARRETAWLALEKDLREKIGANLTQEAVDWICADLRPRHHELMLRTPTVSLPVNSDELYLAIENVIQRNVEACIVQMVKLERELFEHRFGTLALFKPEALRAQAATVHAGQNGRAN